MPQWKQFSGSWTLSQQMQAVGAGTWPEPPIIRELWSWGANTQGQLGLNNTASQSSPVQVGSLTTWDDISLGRFHSIATKLDGTLWAWGYNNTGQLGINSTVSQSSPVQIGSLTTWMSSSSGNYFSIAKTTSGTLWSWGQNSFGQLGLGNSGAGTNRSSPVQIGALTNWKQTSSGAAHTIATKTDGTLWSWGSNNVGQLGLNNTNNQSSPNQIGALTTWLQASAGYSSFSLAIKTDGTLWAWGGNNSGQLGLGDTQDKSSPIQVGASSNWEVISCGGNHTLSIKNDGTLWAWGTNGNGELGDNTVVSKSSPIQVGALTTWLKASAGEYFSLAIKTNGSLWAWGGNPTGQLGLNDVDSRSSPVQIGSINTWKVLPKMSVSKASAATKSP